MAAVSLKAQILDELEYLTPEQQARVLRFTRQLRKSLPPGIPGEVLIARAKAINFDFEDLREMAEAIEEGCERIDWDGWH